MSQKVLSIKVDPIDWEWFKELAKGYKTQAEAFKAIREVYQGKEVNSTNSLHNIQVYQKCVFKVGDKLPLTWELNTKSEETINRRTWYAFPEAQVVAIREKSANGSKSWLEVAIVFPDKVWQEAKTDSRFTYQPVSTLKRTLDAHQDRLTKQQNPVIAEALNNGWQTHHWYWDLSDLVQEAEDYLQVNQVQAVNPCKVYQSVCDDDLDHLNTTPESPDLTSEPLTLGMDTLADRLAPKHLEKSPPPRSDKARANILRDIPCVLARISRSKLAQWTADRDPEGLAWEPADETRENWVSKTSVIM